MAGPLRNLLERRPLRNAVRSLLGLNPRYGSSRMDTMQATDAAQGADLDAPPTRMAPRRDVDNTPYQNTTIAQPPVAPSPEARAVSMNRTQDGQRRQAAQRQSEGIVAQPATSEPRPPETGGFSLQIPIGETDAPPPHPMLQSAERLRKQAEAYRSRAAQIAASPMMRNPSSANYAVGLAHSQALENQAANYDAGATAMEAQYYGQQDTQRLSEEARETQLELARINKPPDTLSVNAAQFRDTVLTAGILPAAQLATDTYFAATQQPVSPEDAAYKARLTSNRFAAAGVAIAARAAQAGRAGISPFAKGDPTLVEIAALLNEYAPNDAAMRSRMVASLMSSVQQQTGMMPEQARTFSAIMGRMLENEITNLKAR